MPSFLNTVFNGKGLTRKAPGFGLVHSSIRLCTVVIMIFLMFASYSLAKNSSASDDKFVEIEYGYPDQSIFIATINDKGQPDTPMTHVAKAIMERAGLSWHATPYPAKRLFENLRSGATNFSILVRASSLKGFCIFSKKPVYSTNLNVYYIGDKPPVTSREDLVGKEIITLRGYSYGGLLKFISDPAHKIVNQEAGTHKAAFEMLKGKRADYLVDYASAAGDILAESPVSGIRSNPLSRLDIFLILSKHYPNAEKLMGKLETIVETMDVNQIIKGKGVSK